MKKIITAGIGGLVLGGGLMLGMGSKFDVNASTYEKVSDTEIKITRPIETITKLSGIKTELNVVKGNIDLTQRTCDTELSALADRKTVLEKDITAAENLGVQSEPTPQ